MAGKRLLNNESDHDPDQPEGKRIRTRPSFAAVISEVVMVKSLQNFCSALEPLLRKVVNEEVELGLRRGARPISRSTPLQIQALEKSTLQLCFSKKLSLPVFTGSKIEDEESNPIQILLVDVHGDRRVPTSLPYPIKVEIVVLDGEFPSEDREDWTSEEFDSKIVRERTGKRPLLTGDVLVTVRDGFASIGDLVFTDNSSWIRSRNFRLAARVAPGSGQSVRIREATTEPFVVKDHRGELYKKHHPPSLNDEVWRLEKIGKDGAFHKKLTAEGVNTVQEFLKLWVVDLTRLRNILGIGMSDKMFEITIKHAQNCVLGNKQYMFRGSRCTIFLNPICQVAGVMHNGQTFPIRDLTGAQKAYVERLARDAYAHWNSLEEVDGMLNETALLPPGESAAAAQYPNHHQNNMRSNNQHCGLLIDGFVAVPSPTNACVQFSDWAQYSAYLGSPIIENGAIYSMPESSSDGDSTPSRAFFPPT